MPLITILFVAVNVFPLFLPAGVEVNKLLRVVIGIAIFFACYQAEVIRGGLQAIPKGQYEAAASLNLTYWQTRPALSCRRRCGSVCLRSPIISSPR